MGYLDYIACICLAVGISWLLSLFVYWIKGSFEYDLKFKYVRQLFELNKQPQDIYLNGRWYGVWNNETP